MKKPTGIVRKVDNAGRILIPKAIRDKARVHKFDYVEFVATRGGVGAEIILQRINDYNPYKLAEEEQELVEYIEVLKAELHRTMKRLSRLRSPKT